MPRLTQLNLGNYIWKGVGNDWTFSKQFAELDLSRVSVYKLSFGCIFLTCYHLFVLVRVLPFMAVSHGPVTQTGVSNYHVYSQKCGPMPS